MVLKNPSQTLNRPVRQNLEHDVELPPLGMLPGVPSSDLVGGLGAVEAPPALHGWTLGEPLGHLGPAVTRDQAGFVVPGLGLALLVAKVARKGIADLWHGSERNYSYTSCSNQEWWSSKRGSNYATKTEFQKNWALLTRISSESSKPCPHIRHGIHSVPEYCTKAATGQRALPRSDLRWRTCGRKEDNNARNRHIWSRVLLVDMFIVFAHLSEATEAVEKAQEAPHQPWSRMSSIFPGHLSRASKNGGRSFSR